MSSVAGQSEKPLEVFISYSRKDLEAAERVRAGIEARGFEAYLDKHDILPGEAWQSRLGQLIATADTVVFLLSPDSVGSPVCDWEVNEAERLGKRILPVMIRDTGAELVPGRLKRLNYVFMRDPAEQATGLDQLCSALNTDIDWLREHTRLGELALDWDRQGRAQEWLQRGAALAAAERWLTSRPRGTLEPTALHRDYIQQGRRAELQALAELQSSLRFRQRLLIASTVLLVGVVGMLVGWINQQLIVERYRWHVVMHPSTLSAAQQEELVRKPGEEFEECKSGCPRMVVVPAGEFLMGAAEGASDWDVNRGPRRKVTIGRPFAVGKFEVTFAEWDACTAAGVCPRTEDENFGRGSRPVISVSWDDAKTYVGWLARITGKPYRLLSEAEWEYAARGITDAGRDHPMFPWGNDVGKGNANCRGCGSQWDARQTAPAGSFKPNAFGLHDMTGNVWEWIEDNWHPSYEGAAADGRARLDPKATMRMLRGGSWLDPPAILRAAVRNGHGPSIRQQNVGFRVARTM